jgi:hypothetical protein
MNIGLAIYNAISTLAVCHSNTLVDGHEWSEQDFAKLDLSRAYVDPGGSIFGEHPYLHCPEKDDSDGVWHRLYWIGTSDSALAPRKPEQQQGVWIWTRL